MQQGWLCLVLLFLLGLPSYAIGGDITATERELWLAESQTQQKVEELYLLALHNEVDRLQFNLQRISYPAQEVVRFLLLQKFEQGQLILTEELAVFIAAQKSQTSNYLIAERGDGYEFSVPAFDYAAIAHRLLKQAQQQQDIVMFVLQAENGELNLREWLPSSLAQSEARQRLLLTELHRLSPQAMERLIGQITTEQVTSWLPSATVMVQLARHSQSHALYQRLWLMKANDDIRQEVARLAAQADAFAKQQLMLAVENPSLKQEALQALVEIRPMSMEVEQFLIEKLGQSENASQVASMLAQSGYQGWLQELVSSNHAVKQQAILAVLNP
ncbi:hypothetical protein DLR69_15765 [Vibrio paracholerae]|uniref:HEAT repeat domain-containing protein n=1 Tax=Vibrio paracholerae TaxID=650003 RepID=A0AAX1QTG5_9VIBR|nr:MULTISPECIES: hypothetical protein [Vibrio]KQA25878.1 hypothetical protein F546_13940 [Vibrio paracholerae 877-163]MBY3673562.1 hypothetical protein [Vibrio cholerae]RBM51701.1 hypothetical protein DLR69_15765 [Vibrio paracholerae]RBM83568.1 hypothetical protein DLR70_05940 [Vibrio paracholerae]GHY15207.1 hypothetical protein VCSRO163_2921 [Vibrio cholerae]